jgi:hypothetical protein
MAAPAPSLAELKALSVHASHRVAVYRRRTYVGQGDPKRLAELERIAHGAAERLRAARGAA